MIETYKIIIGVSDRDATTGLFNFRIDSNTREASGKRPSRKGSDVKSRNTHCSFG